MSLTTGTGPFGHTPGGALDPLVPDRLAAIEGAETAAPAAVVGTGLPPRGEDPRTRRPDTGRARSRPVRAGGRHRGAAVRRSSEPLPAPAPIAGRPCCSAERAEREIGGEIPPPPPRSSPGWRRLPREPPGASTP